MFFLVPLVLSGGAFYLAYDVALMPQGELLALMLCFFGVALMAFALVIAKLESDTRRYDRYELDRLRQEENDINELINDTSDFLREFEANEARSTHSTRYEGDRT